MQIFADRVVRGEGQGLTPQWQPPLAGHSWNLHRWHFMQIYSKLVCFLGHFFCCPLCKQLVQHPLPPLLLPRLTQLAAFALITQILSGRTTRGGNKILHINIIKYAMMNFIERITIVISLSGMLPMLLPQIFPITSHSRWQLSSNCNLRCGSNMTATNYTCRIGGIIFRRRFW